MAERSIEPEERVSRSTAACNGCRTKKQKCGGEKPVCARCIALDQECVWPTQQKRGPAKGYTEALEARLQDTEEVVLRILALLPGDVLHSAFETSILSEDPAMQPATRTSAIDRKESMDHWANFPLRSADDVQSWQRQHRKLRMGGWNEGDWRFNRSGQEFPNHDYGNAPIHESRHSARSDNILRQVPSSEFEISINSRPAIASNHVEQRVTDTGQQSLGFSPEFQQNFLW